MQAIQSLPHLSNLTRGREYISRDWVEKFVGTDYHHALPINDSIT